MTLLDFTLFETPLGHCAIAWNDRGIVATQLPEPTEARARARLRRRSPHAREAPPPSDVQRAIDAIKTLLAGEPIDLACVPLDLSAVAPIDRRVYEAARAIPPGSTLTYGEIATRLGAPVQARDVGQALARNPVPLVVPCHRVVAAGGKLGGFSARGGVATKRRLLALEGAPVNATLPLFDDATPHREKIDAHPG